MSYIFHRKLHELNSPHEIFNRIRSVLLSFLYVFFSLLPDLNLADLAELKVTSSNFFWNVKMINCERGEITFYFEISWDLESVLWFRPRMLRLFTLSIIHFSVIFSLCTFVSLRNGFLSWLAQMHFFVELSFFFFRWVYLYWPIATV